MKRVYKFAAVLLLSLMLAGLSEAVVRDGGIRGKAGLSYGSIRYSFDSISIVIKNSNPHNVTFGGTVLFLNRNYKVIARAELLPAAIKRNASRKYKAFFSYGSGDEAQAAKYLDWEF